MHSGGERERCRRLGWGVRSARGDGARPGAAARPSACAREHPVRKACRTFFFIGLVSAAAAAIVGLREVSAGSAVPGGGNAHARTSVGRRSGRAGQGERRPRSGTRALLCAFFWSTQPRQRSGRFLGKKRALDEEGGPGSSLSLSRLQNSTARRPVPICSTPSSLGALRPSHSFIHSFSWTRPSARPALTDRSVRDPLR